MNAPRNTDAAPVRDARDKWAYGSGPDSLEPGHAEGVACVCGHPRANHADCGRGPCRSNIEIALWHDSNDRKVVGCKCRGYSEPVETVEVDPNG